MIFYGHVYFCKKPINVNGNNVFCYFLVLHLCYEANVVFGSGWLIIVAGEVVGAASSCTSKYKYWCKNNMHYHSTSAIVAIGASCYTNTTLGATLGAGVSSCTNTCMSWCKNKMHRQLNRYNNMHHDWWKPIET